MKYVIAIGTLTMLLMHVNLSAQYRAGGARDRIESQRIAFLTERLNLTPDEATRFWPVYNEYRDGLKAMREDFERPDILSMSEQDANHLIDQHLQREQQRLDMKRNLFTRLRTVIPARKIIQLQVAEIAFNKELLRRVQDFRGE